MSDVNSHEVLPNASDVVTPPAATPENVASPVEGTQDQPENKTEAERKTFTQDEINEIVQKEKAKAEARAERRALKAYRETLERIAPSLVHQPTPQQKADEAPKRENFANDEQWLDARDEWRDARREKELAQQRDEQRARSMAIKTEAIYSEAEKIKGFDRSAFDELPLTPAIAAAIIDSDASAKLMAHLAANPEDVERIAGLSPARQAAEIGKIESRLSAPPKASNAPPPIKPIGTNGSATNSDLSKMSMEEYAAKREAEGASWARFRVYSK